MSAVPCSCSADLEGRWAQTWGNERPAGNADPWESGSGIERRSGRGSFDKGFDDGHVTPNSLLQD